MRYLLFSFALSIHAQTTLTLVPDVITHCSNNVVSIGRTTVAWNYPGPGPVQVRVNAPDGPSITGLASSQGTGSTGDWVHDGLVFVLTDAGSQELARATAHVKCNPAGEVLPAGLAAASYFPLQVGDEWVYADNDRIITGAYITNRVARAELIGNTVWFVIEVTVSGNNTPVETRFRNDDQGRIYQLTVQGEQLWLDPTNPQNPSAILKIDGRGFLAQAPVGQFQDTLSYSALFGSLISERGVFARGIGLLMSTSNMLSGSSGGFVESLNLVYARIDGHIFYTAPSKSIELGVDATDFDVSNKNTANCALPCYFAACGLGGPVDPPGTYRPCFQARVRLGQFAPNTAVDLDVLDASSSSLFHTTLATPSDPDAILFRQVPLYSAPNQPFPPGAYRLRAQTPDGSLAIAPIQLR